MHTNAPRGICLRAALILASVLLADTPAGAAPIDPKLAQSRHGMTAPTSANVAAPAPSNALPRWSELNPAQQQALAPLAGEWDKLDDFRKKKWLAIGNRYGAMKPDEQQRVHERMRDWVKLTPEQRRIARENYARAKKLNPDQKSVKWEQYQQLPEEQKRKLAAAAAARKRVAALPSPSSQSKNHKTLPPIKSAPKPVLERSVTPQAASQSAIQSSPQSQPPGPASQ